MIQASLPLSRPGARKSFLVGGMILATLALWEGGLHVFPPPDPYVRRPPGVQVFEKEGEPLRAYLSPDEKWRLRAPLGKISPRLVEAVLLHEDRRFRLHPGVDPAAVLRAAALNARRGGIVNGASTLSMQLARLVEPGRRSFRYKLFQAFRALQYESRYGKDEILEMYLFLAPYGGNIEGAAAASWSYFGKGPAELSTAEACLLAVIPESPAARNPVLRPEAARAARDRLIDRMEERGLLSAGEASEARGAPLPARVRPMPFRAPHFADWAVRRSGAEKEIRSTIDPVIQDRADRLTASWVSSLRPSGIGQGAVVIVDYERDELVALVGSASFHDSLRSGEVNGATAPRSPGSTLKPFVYALAFDRGSATPSGLVEDVPVHYGSYSPQNYDGSFYGALSAEEALRTSRNVPAVALAAELERTPGPGLYDCLRSAGVRSIDRPREHYGLSLVLGGGDVTLLELADLYAVLARQGVRRPTRWRVEEGGEKEARRSEPDEIRLFSREAAWLTLSILVDVTRPDLDAVWRSGREEVPIPWKTGTSYGHRDAWAVGIAGNYVIAVWLGNFDGSGTPLLVGREVAGPLLFALADVLPHDRPGEWRHPPPKLRHREVCAVSGAPAGPHCGETGLAPFIPGVSPEISCRLHRVIELDGTRGFTVCSRCREGRPADPRVVEWWPPGVAEHLRRRGLSAEAILPHDPECPAFGEEGPPEIISPRGGMEYCLRPGVPDEDQRIAFAAGAVAGSHRIYWFLDGALVWSGSPGRTFFFSPGPGAHTATVKDERGRASSVRFQVTDPGS
ncbi:MAG: penicillin-binding protein 1C [Candidatus Eisenbacteria bacterium]